eukprot:IDg16503t1
MPCWIPEKERPSVLHRRSDGFCSQFRSLKATLEHLFHDGTRSIRDKNYVSDRPCSALCRISMQQPNFLFRAIGFEYGKYISAHRTAATDRDMPAALAFAQTAKAQIYWCIHLLRSMHKLRILWKPLDARSSNSTHSSFIDSNLTP